MLSFSAKHNLPQFQNLTISFFGSQKASIETLQPNIEHNVVITGPLAGSASRRRRQSSLWKILEYYEKKVSSGGMPSLQEIENLQSQVGTKERSNRSLMSIISSVSRKNFCGRRKREMIENWMSRRGVVSSRDGRRMSHNEYHLHNSHTKKLCDDCDLSESLLGDVVSIHAFGVVQWTHQPNGD